MKKNKLKLCLAISLLVTATACGFEPLYQIQGDQSVVYQAAQIDVAPVTGEGGYKMGLILKEKLNTKNSSTPKKYRLTTKISDPMISNQSIRGDNFTSLENMSVTVHYTLTDLEKNTVLVSSAATAQGSYNIVDEPYATTMAKEKTHQNLIQNLANDIVLHMMTYMKGRAP